MPGFVYQVSKRAVAGPDPEQREFGAQVLHAIAATVTFGGLYALFLGSTVVEYVRDPDRALSDVQFLAGAFVLFGLLIPWVAAKVVYWAVSSEWVGVVKGWLLDVFHLRRPYNPVPTAWDWAFKKGEAGWVRVQLEGGRWYGGYYGGSSYASSYPYPQEIFVEQGWVIESDGTFTNVCHAPGGMVIKCTNAVTVDFIPFDTDTEEAEEPEETDGQATREGPFAAGYEVVRAAVRWLCRVRPRRRGHREQGHAAEDPRDR